MFNDLDVDAFDSPALFVDADKVASNIQRMIAIAGDPRRLRPHVKTYKMREIIEAQVASGITRFKAATIAEAELTAMSGATDVLLAYQPVGPKIGRLLDLMAVFPHVRFAALVDHPEALGAMAGVCSSSGRELHLLVDINVGMNRT